MTILERIRPGRRPIELGRIAKDLVNRDRAALERDAADVLDQVKDIRVAAADAIEAVQQLAADAVDRAGDAVGDAVETISGEASKVTRDAAKDVSRTAKDLELDKRVDRVDGRVDDLVDRIRQALPTERITALVSNLERELPTTDGDRYDRAFRRGFARARASFVVIGAATGIAAGIAGAYLLDPQRGPQRRAALQTRVRRTTEDVTKQVRRTATLTTDRAKGFAYERGLIKPADETREPSRDAAAPAPLVPVMDPAVAGGTAALASEPGLHGDVEPVMPVGDGPVTDASSTVLEPLPGTEEPGIPSVSEDTATFRSDELQEAELPSTTSAVTASLEPEAEDATITGEDADRGTWHRTL